mgnify:CR=1 FL=1
MAKKTFKQFQGDSKGLSDKEFGKLLDKKGIKRPSLLKKIKEELLGEGKDGLWDNIRQKKARMKAGSGEKKAKPGDKDYPKTLNVEGLEKARKNVGASTCWDGYKAKGTKKKGGKEVPNCVKEASPALAANTKIQKKEQRKKDEKEYARLMAILAHQKDLKKRGLGEEVVDEGVMKFIKDRVGGKKSPEKKASMDKTTDKLHTWRKSTSDKQKEHEKYVNFLPVDEGKGYQPEIEHSKIGDAKKKADKKRESKLPPHLQGDAIGKMKKAFASEGVKGVDNAMRRADAEDRKAGKKTRLSPSAGRANVAKMIWDIKNAKENAKARGQNEEVVTELNRFGKETGKATGSINKRSGSPVATRNEPASPVNIVRRMIRKDTGRPEGQQKKVKGAKGSVQPGDRKFTPAQTISRMRAQVAAADAAMRDTRGT